MIDVDLIQVKLLEEHAKRMATVVRELFEKQGMPWEELEFVYSTGSPVGSTEVRYKGKPILKWQRPVVYVDGNIKRYEFVVIAEETT